MLQNTIQNYAFERGGHFGSIFKKSLAILHVFVNVIVKFKYFLLPVTVFSAIIFYNVDPLRSF